MIFVCVVIVAAADPELQAIYAQEAERFRQQVQEARKGMTEISCSCGWKNHYTTPGRAKMGLSGHRRWCKS